MAALCLLPWQPMRARVSEDILLSTSTLCCWSCSFTSYPCTCVLFDVKAKLMNKLRLSFIPLVCLKKPTNYSYYSCSNLLITLSKKILLLISWLENTCTPQLQHLIANSSEFLVECENRFQTVKTEFCVSFKWTLVWKYSFQYLIAICWACHWVPHDDLTFVVQACTESIALNTR